MNQPIAVLRPEPGNRVTATAIEAQGRRTIRLPLFAVRSVDWEVPDPAAFDALVLTSANALRHGGAGLARLRRLPVHAVGEVTAEAARRAGFDVVATGSHGAATLMAAARAGGVRKALHLGGRERTLGANDVMTAITVYASEALAIPGAVLAQLTGAVALVQSARAGARLGELVDGAGMDRAGIALAAISAAAALAAGTGWARIAVASSPGSEAVIAAALALTD